MRLNDTQLRYTNPGASEDLVVPINLVAPVSLDAMKANVLKNQQRPVTWIDSIPEHDGVAIICGAGPSLKDCMGDIISLNGEIFASNSAAGYLLSRGIDVDYQVMLDPHPILKTDFAPAKKHLLASIVDPEIFEIATDAVLWHPNTEWIEEVIKPDCPPFTYIGGGVTVTNSALCLAYTMGYRKFHVFGVDSSHKDGKTHVQDVAGLEGFAVLIHENGKEYQTTYDMKQQAVIFMEIYRQLTEIGCTIEVYGEGLLPDMFKANSQRHFCENSTT